MRKARKPLCLLLCAVLLLSMSAAALGANNNYSSWFQTNYDEINKLGLMPASFNGLDLTKNITRGEMCELAVYAFEKATGNDIDMSNETFTGLRIRRMRILSRPICTASSTAMRTARSARSSC